MEKEKKKNQPYNKAVVLIPATNFVIGGDVLWAMTLCKTEKYNFNVFPPISEVWIEGIIFRKANLHSEQ